MGDAPPRPLPEYLTSRDAAALLGIPERRVRQLIRDRTLVGFRAAGHWILPTKQLAQHQPGGQPADSVAALRSDYPRWRVCELSSGYAAILDAVTPSGRSALLSGITLTALRTSLEHWHHVHGTQP